MRKNDNVGLRRYAPASVASAWGAVWRLPTTDAWIWLVRSGALEIAPAAGLVLLHGLPRLLGALGAGAVGHG